jgi:hypothetical protein
MGVVLQISPASGWDEARIQQRVKEIKNSDTNGWRRIPWVTPLPEARAVSQREGRPIFLFTHDGNIETGRC